MTLKRGRKRKLDPENKTRESERGRMGERRTVRGGHFVDSLVWVCVHVHLFSVRRGVTHQRQERTRGCAKKRYTKRSKKGSTCTGDN